MDPFSQAALGAAVGHVACHRRLGLRAAAIGALAGMFPDVDTFYGALQTPFDRLLSHRGATHALWFGPVAGTAAGWCVWWIGRRRSGPSAPGPWTWSALFALALLSHPLLDLCTHYGTQLLAPFSRARFALPAVPAVDPVYTLTLLAGLVAAVLMSRAPSGRARAAPWATGAALTLSTLYLGVGLILNDRAEVEARRQLASAGIPFRSVHAFPTLLQLPWRRVVAISDETVRVGFTTTWRRCPIQWRAAPVIDDPRVDTLRERREGRIFDWFAGGWTVARIEADARGAVIELADLRYGFAADPRTGLWGVAARFDAGGRVVDGPAWVRHRPQVDNARIARLFSLAFPARCGEDPWLASTRGAAPAGPAPGCRAAAPAAVSGACAGSTDVARTAPPGRRSAARVSTP